MAFWQITRITILDRYILWELAAPFFATLILLTSLFLSVFAWKSLGEILVRDLPLQFVFSFLFDFMIQQFSELLAATCLLVGALATGRLSGDLEITAMRAAGISFSRIYFNFFRIGCLVMLVILFLNLYYVPLRVRSRENLLRSLNLHQGLSFVQSGSFIQVPPYPQAGKGFSFYAKESEAGILQELYMQHFTTINDRKHITRITSAAEGLLLMRPRQRMPSKDNIKDSIKDNIEDKTNDNRQLPAAQDLSERQLNLHKKQLERKSADIGVDGQQRDSKRAPPRRPRRLDLSFAVLNGALSENTSYTKLLRLKKGFLFEADPADEGGYTITNFQQGFMDYAIQATPNPTGYIYGRHRIFTFLELFDLLEGMKKGGLTISLRSIYGPYRARRYPAGETVPEMERLKQIIYSEGYQIELPTLQAYRSIKEADREEISKMSPQKILEEKGLYVPPEFDTPKKRRYLLDLSIGVFPDMEKMYRRCSLGLHKRIATAVNALLFMLISLPLGLVSQRSSRGISFGAALLVFFSYNSISYMLSRQVEFGNLNYLIGAWLPELLLLLLSLWLMSLRSEGFSLWFIIFSRYRRKKEKL